MRTFTSIALLFTGLVIAGSIYLYIDTNRFVTDLQPTEPAPDTAAPETETSDSSLPSSEPEPGTTTTTTKTEDGITTHTTVTQIGKAWWDDAAHHGDTDQDTKDPWGDILSEQSKTLTEEELTELNADPYEKHEWHREVLIREHGDIPEVHAFIDQWIKIERRLPRTAEDHLRFLELLNYFYPQLNMGAVIGDLEKNIATGHNVQVLYPEDAPPLPLDAEGVTVTEEIYGTPTEDN